MAGHGLFVAGLRRPLAAGCGCLSQRAAAAYRGGSGDACIRAAHGGDVAARSRAAAARGGAMAAQNRPAAVRSWAAAALGGVRLLAGGLWLLLAGL